MESLRELYKIGRGPSSSHTMGPSYAAKDFASRYPSADRIEAELFGSLAKTGKGHGTDRAIAETLAPKKVNIIFNTEKTELEHPNTVIFTAYNGEDVLGSISYLSIGGGEVRIAGEDTIDPPEVYKENSFSEIAELCKSRNIK